MKTKFKKVKTEHTILPEFHKILLKIEKNPLISRIIPGRISRQQKGSSEKRFRITINTSSGFKCIMSKGATAQEVFIVCNLRNLEEVKNWVRSVIPPHQHGVGGIYI